MKKLLIFLAVSVVCISGMHISNINEIGLPNTAITAHAKFADILKKIRS